MLQKQEFRFPVYPVCWIVVNIYFLLCTFCVFHIKKLISITFIIIKKFLKLSKILQYLKIYLRILSLLIYRTQNVFLCISVLILSTVFSSFQCTSLNTFVKMSVLLPKLIYRFSTVPIKILASFSVKIFSGI